MGLVAATPVVSRPSPSRSSVRGSRRSMASFHTFLTASLILSKIFLGSNISPSFSEPGELYSPESSKEGKGRPARLSASSAVVFEF